MQPFFRTCVTPSLIALSMLVAFNRPVFAADVAASAKRPNIIVVITDDQGYGDLSCHGNPVLKTPNIDQLAQQSVRFTDYHVAPTCSPTRASLLTGHWTNRTGVWHTIAGRSLLPQRETTIATMLRDAGYATGIFGKWHLGDNYPFRAEDHGFEEVFIHGGGGVGQTPDFWDNAYKDGTYWHNGKPTQVEGWCTPVWFERAKSFIATKAESDQPFFAYISTNAPHGPFHSNPKFQEPYQDQPEPVASFFGMIAEIDNEIGKLRRWLKSRQLDRDTIFIFTTDNGTAAGTPVFNAQMRGMKGSAYDGGHRVPLFVHCPAHIESANRDVATLTHAVDFAPTVLELCGVKRDASFDGRSLAPWLLGDEVPTNVEDWKNRILVTDSQRVLQPEKWRASCVMRDRFRLVNRTELYDLATDSSQKTNVANLFPDELKRLQDFYEVWWAEIEPSFADVPRIEVGHAQQNPTILTAHDWVFEGQTPWNQQLIREGLNPTTDDAVWNVNMPKGTYRIRLQRWPFELKHPINASLPAKKGFTNTRAYRDTLGTAFKTIDRAEVALRHTRTRDGLELDAGHITVLSLALGEDATEFETVVELVEPTSQIHACFESGTSDLKLGCYYLSLERLQAEE